MAQADGGRVFEVWFRKEPRPWHWRQFFKWAFEETGQLVVEPGRVRYYGKRGWIETTTPASVSFGLRGMDIINRWVSIQGADGKSYMVASPGWDGVLITSKKLFKAVESSLNQT